MVWPETRPGHPPTVAVHPGYTLRQYKPDDREAYFKLLASAGMSPCRLEYWEDHLLPDGFFVIEHDESWSLVATCMASHHPAPRHPRAGNLGWLAADPAHRGRQLGQAVTAAVTARLIAGGYRRIYLETHDFRLAAIKIYLKMGWVPLLYQEDMHDRWLVICEKLGWPFTPDDWPK
jgi:mycothiol synthase